MMSSSSSSDTCRSLLCSLSIVAGSYQLARLWTMPVASSLPSSTPNPSRGASTTTSIASASNVANSHPCGFANVIERSRRPPIDDDDDDDGPNITPRYDDGPPPPPPPPLPFLLLSLKRSVWVVVVGVVVRRWRRPLWWGQWQRRQQPNWKCESSWFQRMTCAVCRV